MAAQVYLVRAADRFRVAGLRNAAVAMAKLAVRARRWEHEVLKQRKAVR
jgi:hypothetical protein